MRDQVPMFVPAVTDPVEGSTHDAIRQRLAAGASFWGEIVAAVQQAGLPYDVPVVLEALWDLVWNGEITNDSLAPLRERVKHGRKSGSRTSGAGSRGAGRSKRMRARLSELNVAGPPEAGGRWSLVEPLLAARTSDTELLLNQAHQLLERYGVLTRQGVLAEGHPGGFAGVYPILKHLEERGELRRGYFIAGLGAAQFALPGAVDRLRSFNRETSQGADGDGLGNGVVMLSAVDPAQPYGATLDWPDSEGRPARVAGAHVVLQDGEALVELERGGRSLIAFPRAQDSDAWIDGIKSLVSSKRLPNIEIAKVNGIAVRETSWASRLESAGFSAGYRGMLWRGYS